jgi:glucose-fructose oxidoreductase
MTLAGRADAPGSDRLDTSRTPLRLALVGCGRFGEYLGEFIVGNLPAARIVAVVDPDPARRSWAADRFESESFSSVEELVAGAHDRFDAGLVLSPNGQHHDDATTLLAARRHVFCEKPMARTSAECERMVQLATSNGLCLMVGHKRRLRPAWHRLIELMRGHHLGEIRALNVNGWHYHPDIPHWWLTEEEGGGTLHRAGVHDIDFCNAALGEPTWVEATVAPRVREVSEFPEVIWASVGYESGAVAGLQVSLWFTPTHARESFAVQVLGTGGAAKLESTLDEGQLISWGSDPDTLTLERYDDGYEIAYEAELSSFLRWIAHGAAPILTWREGWQAVRVMEAAYRAAAERRRIILPPLPPYH